ncbi:hypothetical protein ABIB82_003921 [Bradyrhizobium sp. i1.8.4]
MALEPAAWVRRARQDERQREPCSFDLAQKHDTFSLAAPGQSGHLTAARIFVLKQRRHRGIDVSGIDLVVYRSFPEREERDERIELRAETAAP